MMKLRLLGAAAAVCSALATPALAQEVISNSGFCGQSHPNADCQNEPTDSGAVSDQRTAAFHDSHNVNRSSRATAWPGDATAIGTTGAIAAAPFRGDSNAYYNNGDRSWAEGYAHRNGFVCQPGTWFHGGDGRQHICQ